MGCIFLMLTLELDKPASKVSILNFLFHWVICYWKTWYVNWLLLSFLLSSKFCVSILINIVLSTSYFQISQISLNSNGSLFLSIMLLYIYTSKNPSNQWKYVSINNALILNLHNWYLFNYSLHHFANWISRLTAWVNCLTASQKLPDCLSAFRLSLIIAQTMVFQMWLE